MLALGQWFYPDLSIVNNKVSNETIYRNRGASKVRLHRRGDATSPTGKFCCEIPDANYILIKMCVNLGELDCNTHRHSHAFTHDFNLYIQSCSSRSLDHISCQ